MCKTVEEFAAKVEGKRNAKTLRIICVEVDTGDALHIGGPVTTDYRTFEMECPPELCEWLSKEDGSYVSRTIVGASIDPKGTP